MRAAIVESPGNIVVRDLPDPVINADQVLIAVEWVSICGSDHHAYLGEFGLRVKFPGILGHEFCGTIAQLGENVSHLKIGTRVVVDPVIHCGCCQPCRLGQLSCCTNLKLLGIDLPGGFGSLVVAPSNTVFEIPQSLPSRIGPLVELTSIACHASARARYAPGESVAIFGAGKLGLTILSLLSRCSTSRLIAVDVDPFRLELARSLGASETINARDVDPVQRVLQLTDGRGVDLCFEAVGSYQEIPDRKSPVTAAACCIRSGGRILVLGQGSGSQAIDWKPLVWKEAEIITSRVSRGEFPRAIDLISARQLPIEKIVTHEMSVEETPEAFRMLDQKREGVVKILLHHA
jgi:threonine dehydrogenase-like Zn-dependent dehydrogenase